MNTNATRSERTFDYPRRDRTTLTQTLGHPLQIPSAILNRQSLPSRLSHFSPRIISALWCPEVSLNDYPVTTLTEVLYLRVYYRKKAKNIGKTSFVSVTLNLPCSNRRGL